MQLARRLAQPRSTMHRIRLGFISLKPMDSTCSMFSANTNGLTNYAEKAAHSGGANGPLLSLTARVNDESAARHGSLLLCIVGPATACGVRRVEGAGKVLARRRPLSGRSRSRARRRAS